MDFIKELYNGNIDINKIVGYISDAWYELYPFIIMYAILFIVCLWFIFKKEGLRPWFSLIPLYNLYLFFKIIKLPFILVFIPIINVITFIIMPYNLSREYDCKKWMRYLSIFIPFIVIPYIAFSKLQNRNKQVEFDYLKYEKDIDTLEDELKQVNDDNYIVDDSRSIPKAKIKDVKTKNSDYIDSIVYSKDDDEYVEDEDHIEYKESNLDNIEEKPIEEVVDLEDINNKVDINEIDILDEDMKSSSKADVKIEQDIKDFKKAGPSVSAIAFGGKEEHENMTEAKTTDDLKCPYCKSSLVGSKGTCPGCGKDVSDIVFEKVKLTKIKM